MNDARTTEEQYSAVVVGARCAGAATAMLLARRGLRVLVVDRARRGSDTLSTHALMRGAVVQLARWGLLDRVVAAGTPSVRVTTFHYGEATIAVPIKPRFGVDALCAPRRTVLDDLLATAAEEAGAELRFGTRVNELSRTAAGRVSGLVIDDASRVPRRIRAGIVIGADGLTSTVARLAGARMLHRGRHGAGVIYGYWAGLPVDGYHWHYRPGVSAGAISTNGGLTCVFASMPAARFLGDLRYRQADGYREVLREVSPSLADLITQATLAGTLRGWAGEPGIVREAAGDGWALVGDAGHFRDPITAHGITDAFRDAELLAAAVSRGTEAAMRRYATLRDAMARPVFDLSDRIASFAWDLDELQRWHRALSDEMVREAEWLASLGPCGDALGVANSETAGAVA